MTHPGGDGNAFRRPPTSQEAVLAELRRRIATGTMRPGERIVQESVAEELGVSRVPVREALKILEGERQVTYEAHHGYIVAQLSLDDLLEVYWIRRILEAEAVRMAIPQMTAENHRRFEELALGVENASARGDLVEMAAINRRFHHTLIEVSASPRLIRLIQQLWDATEAYRAVYYTMDHHERVLDEHRQLVEAVGGGDVEAALAVLDIHRSHAIAALRPVLRDAERPDAGQARAVPQRPRAT